VKDIGLEKTEEENGHRQKRWERSREVEGWKERREREKSNREEKERRVRRGRKGFQNQNT
jgi:hypothetical protein